MGKIIAVAGKGGVGKTTLYGLLPAMDIAILVSDCSRRGIQAAGRIAKLMSSLNLKPTQTGLVVNRVPGGRLDPGTQDEIELQGLNLIGIIPQDDMVYRFDCDGKPIANLPDNSPVSAAFEKVMANLNL